MLALPVIDGVADADSLAVALADVVTLAVPETVTVPLTVPEADTLPLAEGVRVLLPETVAVTLLDPEAEPVGEPVCVGALVEYEVGMAEGLPVADGEPDIDVVAEVDALPLDVTLVVALPLVVPVTDDDELGEPVPLAEFVAVT